jgi:hypothetical protein
MKRKKIIGLSLGLILILSLIGVSPVMAAKPQKNGAGKDVITLSNGFPSGAHYNLNIHGKSETYECTPYDPLALDHNVVNIPEYGIGTITYVSGKKVKIDELTVFDACSESFDGDPAEVWIPSEAEGYWVFARALGKPAKGNPADGDYEPRSIIIENAEYSPIAYSLFGDVSNPDEVPLMLPLGLITQGGDYEVDSTTEAGIKLVRFDSEPEGKGRGKTLGKNITDMFMWTGWVFQAILDTDGDGDVDFDDVPASYDTNGTLGIQEDEFQAWLADNEYGWVFPTSLDLNDDGVVDEADVPIEYDYLVNGGNGNGYIDTWDGVYDPEDPTEPNSEFERWLADNIPSGEIGDCYLDLWEHYETPIWVFNIADLVYHDQVYTNNGIKNLQIRFYPVATTEFSPTTVE